MPGRGQRAGAGRLRLSVRWQWPCRKYRTRPAGSAGLFYAVGRIADTNVPWPRCDVTVRRPPAASTRWRMPTRP